MEFSGVKLFPINSLGISQMYLSSNKIQTVKKWFNPNFMKNFEPLPVHDFGNGVYTLTDGHTRAYVAYKSDLDYLPVVYDRDDIVANETGQTLYKACIDWCSKFKLSNISHLENRILRGNLYEKLWLERCSRNYNLITKTSQNRRMELQKTIPELLLYGASEDLSILFFENEAGELFSYKDGKLLPEK